MNLIYLQAKGLIKVATTKAEAIREFNNAILEFEELSLEPKKALYCTELDNTDMSVYTENESLVLAAIQTGKANINSAKTTAELELYYNNAKAQIKAIKTDAELLAIYKIEKIAELHKEKKIDGAGYQLGVQTWLWNRGKGLSSSSQTSLWLSS